MAHPVRAKTFAELDALSEEDLKREHDGLAGMGVAPSYYLDELRARQASRREVRMERLTWTMAGLTVANVLIAVLG